MTLLLLLSMLLMPGLAPAEGGNVLGTLRGTDGSPAARVRVAVMAMPERGRGLVGAGTLVSQAETDDAGRFQLAEVPPGRYYIVAGRLEAPTFYPGVRDIGSAKTIEVPAKVTVRNIDFAVVVMSAAVAGTNSSLSVVKVTGRVVLKNNSKASMPPNVTLQASPVLSDPPRVVFPAMAVTAPVAPDGVFKADLFAANQRLSVAGLPAGYSVESMTADGKNILDQPVDIKLGIELNIALDVGDARPRYRLLILVREDSSERALAGEQIEFVYSSGEIQRLTVNAQGQVTIPGLLPGTYTLRLVSANFDAPEKRVVITDGSVQVELRARNKP